MEPPVGDATVEEIDAFARRVAAAPYEAFSRFLLDEPRYLEGDEALAHLERGWGLHCSEKARLMAHFLSGRGVANSIVGGDFELWLMGQKTSAPGLAAEVSEERALEIFAPGRKTSPYEVPPRLAHLANQFTAGGVPRLVDCLGVVAPFRAFAGAEVERLLDAPRKAYVTHMPFRQRLYYHRVSSKVLALVEDKLRGDRDFLAGRCLITNIVATERSIVSLRWWWRDELMEKDLSLQPTMVTRFSLGEMSLSHCTEVGELAGVMAVPPPEPLLDGLRRAWPVMRGWIDRLFERPPHVRFSVYNAKAPFADYASNELREA